MKSYKMQPSVVRGAQPYFVYISGHVLKFRSDLWNLRKPGIKLLEFNEEKYKLKLLFQLFDK